jgi:hypothetical protein
LRLQGFGCRGQRPSDGEGIEGDEVEKNRGVSPPHGNVLFSGKKSTQKGLLLAEGI